MNIKNKKCETIFFDTSITKYFEIPVFEILSVYSILIFKILHQSTCIF